VARGARGDDVEAARKDFAEGVQRLEGGDYEGARRLFESAYASHPAPAIAYNLGVAEEHLSHPQAAVDAYARYLADAGDEAALSEAAATAIAQIRARSTRLRIETRPAGARLFVDGLTLAERSPSLHLVTAGRHRIVAQGDGLRAEAEVEAAGAGDLVTVVLSSPEDRPAPAAPPRTPSESGSPTKPARPGPRGFVWGASFALAPYHLIGASAGPNRRGATQVMAGATIELGGAVTDRFELFARGLFALGPEAKPSVGPPVTHGIMVGPGASVRLGSSVWLGTTFVAGSIETVAHDAFYGTDLVFGAMGEAAVAVITTPSGQYLLGAQPGALLASERDNTALVLPLTFGYRAY
jgi:hypothetical protein